MIIFIAILLNIALAVYIFVKDPTKATALIVGFIAAFMVIGLINAIDWTIRYFRKTDN